MSCKENPNTEEENMTVMVTKLNRKKYKKVNVTSIPTHCNSKMFPDALGKQYFVFSFLFFPLKMTFSRRFNEGNYENEKRNTLKAKFSKSFTEKIFFLTIQNIINNLKKSFKVA